MSEVQILTAVVVALTLALYMGIAIWSRAKTTSEFYVAGGGVHPIANGMATAALWMSAATFISMAGFVAVQGYGGSVFLMGGTGGYVLLALLVVPYLRKHGSFTVPEFISDRCGSPAARAVAILCLLLISLIYIIGQMKGIGVAFARFLEVSFEAGLIAGIIIVLAYAVIGGMKGITYTQIAQYVILLIAYTVPAIFISLTITGHALPQIGLGGTVGDSSTYLLDKLDQIVTEAGFKEYTTAKRISTLNMFAYTLSLMIGAAGMPHLIMRFFTVPSVRAARSSVGWTMLFVALLFTAIPGVAAMARLNMMQTLEPEPGEYLAYDNRPEWFKNWETTGLLAFEDKNGDQRIQYVGDADANELQVHIDIMTLANPEVAGLPSWVIALVAAGALAAALSTAAGLLIAIASAISHDLLRGMIKPSTDDQSALRTSRASMAFTVLLAGVLGFAALSVFDAVATAFTLAAASLFPALVLGIFTKMNKHGIIAGMLAGLAFTMFYAFQHHGVLFIPGTSFLGSMEPNWLLGLEPNACGPLGAIVNFAVAFIVAKMAPAVGPETEQLIANMRLPKGGVKPAVHLGEVAEH